jgi:hypothetical protein
LLANNKGQKRDYGIMHNFDKRYEVIKEIYKERARQECLHPLANYNDRELMVILTEEVGEVARAIQDGSNVEEELVHVAAVCFRWLENRVNTNVNVNVSEE